MSSTSPTNPINQIASLLIEESNNETSTNDEAPIEAVDENLPEIESSESLDTNDTAPEMEASDESSEQTDEEVVDTLNNLAEELDIPVTDLYALNVKLSEGEPITLGGLKDFYEANKDIDELKETIKQREIDLQNDYQSLNEAPVITNELLQARAQVLSIQDQYNRTNWEELRTTDPGTYAALQQDFRTHFELAKLAETDAENAVATHKTQARQLQQDRLYDAVPQLKDETFRQEAEQAILKLTAKYGFTPNDVANIEDSRLMRLLIDASKITNAVEHAKDKMEDKTPRSNKSSASRPMPSSRKATLKRLSERAKASGQTRDKVAAVSALLT